jgi:cysteine synthase A
MAQFDECGGGAKYQPPLTADMPKVRVPNSILDAVGNTPMVELKRIVPPGSARVLVKLEYCNPTGSMKDRVAKAMVAAAESDGRIRPGGTVVEYTGGSTGVSLGLVCAAKGLRLKIVFSDAFSEEKRRAMEAFGAEVEIVKSEHGKMNEQLFKNLVAAAQRLGKEPGHWFCDQLSNHDGAAGYHALAEEIWEQSGGKVDAFVQCVGTAHSIHGVTDALWKHDPKAHIAAVEPAESAVLSGGPTGSHFIEGIGIGYIPPLWNPSRVNSILSVSSEEAKSMCRRLAKEEAIFAGTSSGANMVGALRLASRLGPKATVVTLMVDSGFRYLSTDLFRAP